jgi:FkbM family methyltransferase
MDNPFISYSQNFEDLMINRCFGKIEKGLIVDVGAHDPIFESVTYAFFRKCWKTINIEPLEKKYLKYLELRPTDINLNIAIGPKEGIIDFFDIGNEGGLSTARLDTLELHRKNQVTKDPFYSLKKTRVLQVPLTKILHQYDVKPNFEVLKIDVEGAEKDVLLSLDFSIYKPKLVIVEATAPTTQIFNFSKWENILLKAKYVYVYFDGSNRYYLSKDVSKMLSKHFINPPSAFDNVIRARGLEEMNSISELHEYFLFFNGSTNIGNSYSRELEDILNSTSWKITKPLRATKNFLARRGK